MKGIEHKTKAVNQLFVELTETTKISARLSIPSL